MGIGRAVALELARLKVNLALNARNAGPLEEIAALCRDLGVIARPVAGSAARSEVASGLVSAALEIGRFHGFIHAAGVLHPGPFLWELNESQYQDVFESSVTASYQLIRHAAPTLLEQGKGVAVFFGSGAAERNMRGMGAYCAAKATEEALARQFAVEAPTITSFIYRPGVVDTRMHEQARSARGGAGDELQTFFRGYRDRGDLLSPEEAARALIRILTGNPRSFHGQITTWRDGHDAG